MITTLKQPLWSLLAVLLALVSFSVFATPKPEKAPPGESRDLSHLQEVKHSFFDTLNVASNANLTSAKKIYIEPANVAFSKYWLREHQTDITGNYKKKTIERYETLLNKELAKAVEKSTEFELVNNAVEADLIFVPRIENLNIFGPDDSISKSFVFIAGNGKFNLLVVDAKSEEVLYQFIDSRDTQDRGYNRPARATRAFNTRDFKMLMGKWSDRTMEYLGEQKSK